MVNLQWGTYICVFACGFFLCGVIDGLIFDVSVILYLTLLLFFGGFIPVLEVMKAQQRKNHDLRVK